MSVVKWIEVGFVGLGILCMVGGDRLPSPLLLQAGLALIGLGLMTAGVEAMVTRRFSLQRRGFSSATYRGWAAVLNGIIFLWIGLVVVGLALVLFMGTGQAFVDATIRHPGAALVTLSFPLLAGSGVVLLGTVETRLGAEVHWFLRALSALLRSIPALILLLLALALLALGLLEIVSPATFDQLGGGFLEVLFLERPS